jgi:hypothetical protein
MEDLARQSGAAVVFPYYTPAPEAQYPTQFEQSYGVLEYILKNGQKHKLMVEQVALAGDSVGGMHRFFLHLPACSEPTELGYPRTNGDRTDAAR